MSQFSLQCQRCPRLSRHLHQIKQDFPTYYAKPVPAFGALSPRLLIVGLAPGLHGANATGRPFTGDYAGILLYQTLYHFGFSNQCSSVSRDDNLILHHCRITNAVKCLPPANKPLPQEIITCNDYLKTEIQALTQPSVILALGTIAHKAVVRALELKPSNLPFSHGAIHNLQNRHVLVDSYHCSRYNTQTKRLTTAMFEHIFHQIKDLLQKLQ